MTNKQATPIEALIESMAHGDAAARREFLGRVYDRVCTLARNVLHARFPRLRFDTESASVANRACAKLLTLENLTTPTVTEFMRVCANTVERVLLDIARKKKRRPADFARRGTEAHASNSSRLELLEEDSHEPSRPAEGIELLERVSGLPEDLRDVVLQHGYLEVPQSEVAKLMALHPKEVSRRWNEAKRLLREGRPTLNAGEEGT
jgi:DNA-directed RNA polymerase specialized sigma24 family protein